MGLVIRVLMENGHPCCYKPVDHNSKGYDKNRGGYLHKAWVIPLGRRQVPVKCNQTDIQTVEDNTQHGPGCRPFYDFQVFFTHADVIKKLAKNYPGYLTFQKIL